MKAAWAKLVWNAVSALVGTFAAGLAVAQGKPWWEIALLVVSSGACMLLALGTAAFDFKEQAG